MSLSTTYLVYLTVSVAFTVWVARTLHSRGRVFLVESFAGDETVADATNSLLVVGFYLINFGYVSLALKYGTKPTNLNESIEFLSTKIGTVLLILGAMHCFNLFVFAKVRSNGERKAQARNPLGT